MDLDLDQGSPTDVASSVTTAPPGRRLGSRPKRLAAVMAGAALVVLALGATGVFAASDGPSAPPSGSTVDTTDVDAAFGDFAACMRDHGIDMPDPVKLTAVSAADLTPVTVTGDAGAPIDASGSGTITVVTGSAIAIGETDPKLAAADEACSPILEKAGIHAATSGGLSGPASGSIDLPDLGTQGVSGVGFGVLVPAGKDGAIQP